MRYHWCSMHITPDLALPPGVYTLTTDHPAYSCSTLFTIKNRGLSVIMQKYDERTKHTWWGPIDDPHLVQAIYYNPKFKEYFEQRSEERKDGNVYPTVTVRQLMWALRMKPLPKAAWETTFDRRDI